MTNQYNIRGSATVAASAAAATIQMASLTYDPSVTAVVQLQVPSTQTWIVQDIYISASADAGTSDPQIRMFKNTSIILGDTQALSGLLISNNARPAQSVSYGYEPMTIMSDQLITTVANDATADSIKYVKTTQVLESRR